MGNCRHGSQQWQDWSCAIEVERENRSVKRFYCGYKQEKHMYNFTRTSVIFTDFCRIEADSFHLRTSVHWSRLLYTWINHMLLIKRSTVFTLTFSEKPWMSTFNVCHYVVMWYSSSKCSHMLTDTAVM